MDEFMHVHALAPNVSFTDIPGWGYLLKPYFLTVTQINTITKSEKEHSLIYKDNKIVVKDIYVNIN